MTTLSARFRQSPSETKRYVLDYTLQLAPGESIVSVASNVVQNSGTASPPLAVTGVALLPPVNTVVPGAVYLISGGVDQGQYEVQFLATTSIGQILEDVVSYVLAEKL